MTTSLKDNAYHILGLDGSANGRQILQRANEIGQRLKIDDVSKYDLDIPLFKQFRSEESVRDALRRLQAPKARIKEYFFWFRISDEVDREALGFLAQKDYKNAIGVWQVASDREGEASFRYRRNLALAYCIALLTEKGQDQLQESLNAWKAIFESEKFWLSFLQTYKLDTDHTVSDEAIADFQTSASGYLSDIYAEIQEVRGTTEYVYKFRQVFAAKGERIEKGILDPSYRTIQTAIEVLEQINVGEKDEFDREKANQIKEAVSLIQSELNKLIEAGLYDDSGTKVLRDRTSNALRRISVDLHNQHGELETSAKLLEVAVRIAGTDSLQSMLSADLKQIQENISYDEQNSLTLEIPGSFGGGTVVFKSDYLTYNNRKIFYRDATSISYHAISRSVNLIPISQSYSYMVASESQTISFSFGTTLFIGNKKKKDVWAQLAGLSDHFIQPHIVEKLVTRIFGGGETVKIGSLEFGREGYSRSKMFGGREAVAWNDTVYIPVFSSGNVVVWKAKNGKAAAFVTLPMSIPNAVVLPEFVKACVAVVQSHAKR